MSYNFFAFLDRMKYIKRWQLMRSVRDENIMEHTAQVALFTHCLALINNRVFGGNADAEMAVLYALYHESAEVLTGDLPTPIKYMNGDINGAYKNIEKSACDKLLSTLPSELRADFEGLLKPDQNSLEYALMKAADRLSAYVKCLEELKIGNSEFEKAKKSIEKDLKSRNLKEVNYFFENFIDGYRLTLDELD